MARVYVVWGGCEIGCPLRETTLWSCFGDVIVSNLKSNIEERYGENNTQCDICFKRIEVKGKIIKCVKTVIRNTVENIKES